MRLKFIAISLFWMFSLTYINAQTLCSNVFKPYLNKKVFIFGESHWQSNQTDVFMVELFDDLVSTGKKNIKIGVEYPPSIAFKLQMFLETKDTFWLQYFILNNQYHYLMKHIVKHIDSVKISIIPLDVEFRANLSGYKYLRDYMIKNDSLINLTQLKSLIKANSRKQIQKEIEKIMSDSLSKHQLIKRMEKGLMWFYWKEIEVIYQYGFMTGGRTGKKVRNRERRMTTEIEFSITDSNSVIIATLGRRHLTELDKAKKSPRIFNHLKSLKRSEIVLIPIFYNKYDVTKFNGQWISKEKGNFDILIKSQIFDLILFANCKYH